MLYIKPRNTHRSDGAVVPVPGDAPELEIGAALGLVIGRTACRVAASDALSVLAGYTVLIDVSVPHSMFYRPSIRFKARDGFCPIGPAVTACRPGLDPDELAIRVLIDGAVRQQASTSQLVRPVSRLLAEITDFMTLSPGDILMVGIPVGAPLARAGQSVAVEIDGVGRLQARLQAGSVRGSSGMKRARVAYSGAVHEAVPTAIRRTAIGSGWPMAANWPAPMWVRLRPFEAGTIVALGLNYADHAKELAFNSQDEPLVFLEGAQCADRPSRPDPASGRCKLHALRAIRN